jgi:hypothetical protein
MKRYKVECIQRYLDGGSDTEIIYVTAYDHEHAEELAFDRCGGPWGQCTNMEFCATLIPQPRRIRRG